MLKSFGRQPPLPETAFIDQRAAPLVKNGIPQENDFDQMTLTVTKKYSKSVINES